MNFCGNCSIGFKKIKLPFFVSLPVTSCSAKCMMSHIRIVKNRLRFTMVDWLSSLLCLASTHELSNIINRFADCSDSLWRQLKLHSVTSQAQQLGATCHLIYIQAWGRNRVQCGVQCIPLTYGAYMGYNAINFAQALD